MQTPEQLRALRIVALGLLMGPALLIGVALFLRSIGGPLGSFEVLSYVAAGFALTAPLLAGTMRHKILSEAGDPPAEKKVRQAVIVSFGILEGAAMLCAVALLFSSTYWALLAAPVPLATMLAWFPKAE